MDRNELIASVLAARPSPGEMVYVERRGDEYAWHGVRDAAGFAVASPGVGYPDAWMWFSGNWPVDDPTRLGAFVDDLLAEMESAVGGSDRCRWPLDAPWPQHGGPSGTGA